MGLKCALAGMLLSVAAIPASGQQAYPNHPVQLIIAYGGGSVGDVSMRLLAKKLTEKLGMSFVVDNRPGAGGIVAARAVAAAAPDGYTLLLTGNSYAISTALFNSLPYNILNDFVSISTVAAFDMLILTKTGSPLKSLQDVIAFAKKNPGKLNIGTLSAGTTQFLAVEMLKIEAGINVTTVPFRTSTEVATALIRGDVDVVLDTMPPMQSLIQTQKATVIATAGRKRFLPDVPTAIESGVRDFDASSWNGIAAPAGTPRPIVDTLSKATIEVLRSSEVQDTAHKLGIAMGGSTPEDITARMKNDIKKWSSVIEKANIAKLN
jgi:tripartite-type tricarboxylate transporter receptor subunit TctC